MTWSALLVSSAQDCSAKLGLSRAIPIIILYRALELTNRISDLGLVQLSVIDPLLSFETRKVDVQRGVR